MCEEQKNTRRAYIIETIMFFTYVFFGVNWIVGTSLTPEIMDHFQLDNFASATFLSNAITFAKIVGNLVAAKILYKLFPKKAIGLASFCIFFGTFIAVIAPAYSFFIFGRFIMGFGGALYIVYFNPIVIHYFTEDKRPMLNTFNNACYNVGTIVAFVFVGPVVVWLNNWKLSMIFFMMFSLILFILWMIFGEDFEIFNKNEKNGSLIAELKYKFNWILPITYAGRLTEYLAFLTIFPISGISILNGRYLTSLLSIGGLAGSFIAMIYAKRNPKRLPIIRFSGIGMPLSGIMLLYIRNPIIEVISAFLIGVFVYLPLTSIFTIPQEKEGITISKLTAIMSLFWVIAYVFETSVYYAVGLIIDAHGYTVGLLVASLSAGTAFIGSFLLPETGDK